jgi:hypothetical protein
VFLDGGDALDPMGFAIGGTVGMRYDPSRRLFLAAEVGYQRAFATSRVEF